MHPRTEELLNCLLWTASQLTRPTFRNLMGSYESWAYGNGWLRQLRAVEERGLVERQAPGQRDQRFRLTARGCLHALGGRDPAERWAREWDGRWRAVLFDIPVIRNNERNKLRRHLRERAFGRLQNSAWITPDPIDVEPPLLADGRIDLKAVVILDARPSAGRSDADLVACAWDFGRINQGYAEHLEILESKPADRRLDELAARALKRWAARERQAWIRAVTLDPLLPEKLLPPGYLGQRAWRRRVQLLGRAGRQWLDFHD